MFSIEAASNKKVIGVDYADVETKYTDIYPAKRLTHDHQLLTSSSPKSHPISLFHMSSGSSFGTAAERVVHLTHMCVTCMNAPISWPVVFGGGVGILSGNIEISKAILDGIDWILQKQS